MLVVTTQDVPGQRVREVKGEDARQHAIDRMVANAQARGANAVVMMRFDSSEIGGYMSEIVAYGTAVVLEPDGN